MRAHRQAGWTWSVVLAGLACAVVAGAGPAAAPAQPASTQAQPAPGRTAATVIVPGYSIGPWTLDTRIDDLLFRLAQDTVPPGELLAQIRPDIKPWVWVTPPLIALAPYTSPDLLALGISGPEYATRDGIGPGATQEQITGAYGAPTATVWSPGAPKLLLYDNRGLAFRLPFDGVAGAYGGADAVFVFRPGQAAVIWRVH